MKAWIAALTVLASVLLVAMLALMAFGWSEQRHWRESNLLLQTRLGETREALSAATAQNQALSNRLGALETSASKLEARLEEVRVAAKAAEDTLPRAYRVRAYLGRDSLGEAWMVPQNISRDPATGRYRFEPVLVLDESNRQRFTVHHTNTVQTEIVTTERAPYYYAHPYYFVGGVPPLHGGTNLPPVMPQPPGGSPPLLPTPPDYRDVSLRAQMFAPPLNVINSRPQTLGRPATSPINAQIFAP